MVTQAITLISNKLKENENEKEKDSLIKVFNLKYSYY